MLKTVTLGGLELPNNLWMSPLCGVTDIPFRALVHEQGAGLVHTQMVSCAALARGGAGARERTAEIMALSGEEGPVGIQLFGSDLAEMAESARMVEERGADLVSLNFGCPVPKVVKHNGGSSLLREPALVQAITAAVVQATRLPVVPKIRLGWDQASVNAVEIAQRLEQAGAAALVVHGRTPRPGLHRQGRLGDHRQGQRAVGIPVIGNGDLFTPQDIELQLKQSGVDGVMLGRGAMGNPLALPPGPVPVGQRRGPGLALGRGARGHAAAPRGPRPRPAGQAGPGRDAQARHVVHQGPARLGRAAGPHQPHPGDRGSAGDIGRVPGLAAGASGSRSARPRGVLRGPFGPGLRLRGGGMTRRLGWMMGLALGLAACAGSQRKVSQYDLALYLQGQGKPDEALQALQRSLAIDPTTPPRGRPWPRPMTRRAGAPRPWRPGNRPCSAARTTPTTTARTARPPAARPGSATRWTPTSGPWRPWCAAIWRRRTRPSRAPASTTRPRRPGASPSWTWTTPRPGPLLARSDKKLKDNQGAYDAWKRCADLSPKDPDTLKELGFAAFALTKLDEAEASFKRYTALQPADPKGYNNQGTVLALLNRFAESQASFDKALAIQPDMVAALNGKATAYYYQKRYDKARQVWAHVLELSPDDPTATENIATLTKMGY